MRRQRWGEGPRVGWPIWPCSRGHMWPGWGPSRGSICNFSVHLVLDCGRAWPGIDCLHPHKSCILPTRPGMVTSQPRFPLRHSYKQIWLPLYQKTKSCRHHSGIFGRRNQPCSSSPIQPVYSGHTFFLVYTHCFGMSNLSLLWPINPWRAWRRTWRAGILPRCSLPRRRRQGGPVWPLSGRCCAGNHSVLPRPLQWWPSPHPTSCRAYFWLVDSQRIGCRCVSSHSRRWTSCRWCQEMGCTLRTRY